jgi:hypothetical protein
VVASNEELEKLVGQTPLTLRQALKHSQAPIFLLAKREEFYGLCDSAAFGFIDDPKEIERIMRKFKPLRLGMTCRVTSTPQRDQLKVKVRMYVLGCDQPAWQIGETFAPTVRASPTRYFLALSVQNDLVVRNIDIKMAYLHADAPEDVYVIIPKELSGLPEYKLAKLN